MDVCKSAFWNGDGRSWRCSACVNFWLFGMQGIDESRWLCRQPCVTKQKGKKANGEWPVYLGGLGNGHFPKLLLERKGDQRAKNGCGNIT
jgi:hypothetical protein